MVHNEITWSGPFAWPSFENSNKLNSLPQTHGVYLQTFEYETGYLIYAAGITRRTIAARFKEHTKKYLDGDYNVLDVNAVKKGIRKEIWHGWDYARKHRKEFQGKKARILRAVQKQLAAFCIFIAETSEKSRFPERLEAAIMNSLYKQIPPLCTIPDQGMFLAPRRDSEDPIVVRNICQHTLYGLSEFLEI